MLIWFCYLVVTFLFLLVGFGSVHAGGFVAWLLRLGIVGCFMLSVLAMRRVFFDPPRGLRNALTGCLLMLPLFAAVLLPTYGVPMGVTLLTMYYTKYLMNRGVTSEQMLRHTMPWRINLAQGFLAMFLVLLLLALLLGSFPATNKILEIGDGGGRLWKPRP